MLYDTMLSKSQELASEIKSLQARLTELPGDRFFCTCSNGRYKWYRNDGQKQIYIPKKERALAEQLAMKKYLSLRLEELLQEKRAIDFYLRHHNVSESPSKQLLAHPAYQELLTPSFSLTDELSSWMNAPYDTNPLHPEHRIHKTISGHLVRSKSEAIIDTFLYMNRIPFRYECSLHLGEITLYPDFTILHPLTGTIFYWEHFGLIDQSDYRDHTAAKLQHYISHGIIPTSNLIITCETKGHPLSPELVEKMVKLYLL